MLKKELKIIIPIFIIIFTIYLLTCNHCLSLVLDSACSIADIARSDYILFPHHLLYHAAFYHWHDLLLIIGFSNIVSNLASFNSLFGALSVVLIYIILRIRFKISVSKAIIYTTVPAFSFGFWMVSTSVNVYAISLFCQLLMYYLYLQDTESWKKWVMIGLVNGIAIIFNQWNVFIFIVITINMLLDENRKQLFKKYFWYYTFPSVIVSLGAYLFVLIYKFELYSLKSMLSWMTYYKSVFEWTTSLGKALKEAIIGIGQTIIAPYWLFGITGFHDLIKGNLQSNVSFLEEVFFAQSFSPTVSWFLTISAILLVLILVTLSIISISQIKKTIGHRKKESLYLFVWIIISSIMPFFWSGYNQRYWFIQTTAFYLFIFLSVSIQSRINKNIVNKLIVLLAVIMFTVNLFGIFIYSGDVKKDLNYLRTKEIINKSTPGDIIIFRNIWTMSYYLDIYGNKSKWINLHVNETRNQEKINKTINQLKKIDKILLTNNIILTEDIFQDMEQYPDKLRFELENIKLKYSKRMKYFKTKYINFHYIPADNKLEVP